MLFCYHFIPDSPRRRKARSKNIMKNNKQYSSKLKKVKKHITLIIWPYESITFENLDEMFSFPKPRKSGSKMNKPQ